MPEILEHTLRTDRHTTGYLAAGPEDGPAGACSCTAGRSCRSAGGTSCRRFAAWVSGDRAGHARLRPLVAYAAAEAYAQEHIVADMIELLDRLGRGAGGVGRARLGRAGRLERREPPPRALPRRRQPVRAVPARSSSRLRRLVALVDRTVYPVEEFPDGQWDYQAVLPGAARRVARGLRRRPVPHRQGAVPQGQPERPGPARGHRARSAGRAGGSAGPTRAPGPPARPRGRHRGRPAQLRRGARPQRLLRAGRVVPQPRGERRVRRARRRRRHAADACAVPRCPLRRHVRGRQLAAGGAATRSTSTTSPSASSTAATGCRRNGPPR